MKQFYLQNQNCGSTALSFNQLLNQTRITNTTNKRISNKQYPSLLSTFRSKLQSARQLQQTFYNKPSTNYQNFHLIQTVNKPFKQNISRNSPFNSVFKESQIDGYNSICNHLHQTSTARNSINKEAKNIIPYSSSALNLQALQVISLAQYPKFTQTKSREQTNIKYEDIKGHEIQKNEYVSRLDELQYAIQKLSYDYQNYYLNWMAIYNTQNKLFDYEQEQQRLNRQIQKQEKNIKQLKEDLYRLNKEYFSIDKCEGSSNNNSNLINGIIKEHQKLMEKLIGNKSNFIQNMIFNMRVLLPNGNQNTIHMLYKRILQQKLIKKFILITKKQMINLNSRQTKLVQDFIKYLTEIESKNKNNQVQIQKFDIQSFQQFKKKCELILKSINEIEQRSKIKQQQIQNLIKFKKQLNQQIKVYKRNIEKQIQKQSRQLQQQYQQSVQPSQNKQLMFIQLLTQKYQKQKNRYIQFIKEKQEQTIKLKRCMEIIKFLMERE